MKKEHISEIAEIERECFSHPWSESSLEMLLEENGFAMVAFVDGKVVGYGGVLTVLDEGQITDVAVKSEYRRRGIGMDIIKAIILHSQTQNISSLYLEVRESNFAARELYRACGFEECGIRKGFYTNPRESAILMKYQVCL